MVCLHKLCFHELGPVFVLPITITNLYPKYKMTVLSQTSVNPESLY